MKTKCLKLLTWNVYIFYFLLCSVENGWARSTNQSSQSILPHSNFTHTPQPMLQHRQTIIFRHERQNVGFYNNSQQPLQQPKQRHLGHQQQQSFQLSRPKTTPMPEFKRREIHEAVHAFHPSNNLHLRHSLQNNYHPIRSHLTTISSSITSITTNATAAPRTTTTTTTRKAVPLTALSASTSISNSHSGANRYRYQHQQPQTQFSVANSSYHPVYKVNQNINTNISNASHRGSFNKHLRFHSSTAAPTRHSTASSQYSYGGGKEEMQSHRNLLPRGSDEHVAWKTMGVENIFTTQRIRKTTTSPVTSKSDRIQLSHVETAMQPSHLSTSFGRNRNFGGPQRGGEAPRRNDNLENFTEENGYRARDVNRLDEATLDIDDGTDDYDENELENVNDGFDDDDVDDDEYEDGGVDIVDGIDAAKRSGMFPKLQGDEDDDYDVSNIFLINFSCIRIRRSITARSEHLIRRNVIMVELRDGVRIH